MPRMLDGMCPSYWGQIRCAVHKAAAGGQWGSEEVRQTLDGEAGASMGRKKGPSPSQWVSEELCLVGPTAPPASSRPPTPIPSQRDSRMRE